MNIKIYPSKVNGKVAAPPSKSMTHRAVIIASLAQGTSVVRNALISNDTLQTINACRAFGVKIKEQDSTLIIQGSGGQLATPKKTINVNNSGTTMRFITAVAALASGKTIITGSKRLLKRPITSLNRAVKALNVIEVRGKRIITAGRVEISANVSSQFVSALLLVAPFAPNGLQIVIKGTVPSKPYINLTIKLMKLFGVRVVNEKYKKFTIKAGQTYHAANIAIEGDFSSASYFFAAAALTDGQVSVANLNTKSLQGDTYFLEILQKMGCKITVSDHTVKVQGKPILHGLRVDMSDAPDSVQTLSAVASYATGQTQITNIGHLTYKETDRIGDTAKELRKIGINVAYNKNSLIISGSKPKGGVINTHNDHRMAMSMAVAALGAEEGIVIKNAQVVSKSYPGFWHDLVKLGVKMEVVKE